MKRTRLGVTAAVLGSALLGSVSAAEWRGAYALPAAARCDLAGGYATAALLAPTVRGRLAASESSAIAIQAAGVNPLLTTRHGNLGFGAAMGSLQDVNGPQTSFPRQSAYDR